MNVLAATLVLVLAFVAALVGLAHAYPAPPAGESDGEPWSTS